MTFTFSLLHRLQKVTLLATKMQAGAIKFCFGGYVLHRFSKVSSTEQTFGSQKQNFDKICVFRGEILPKSYGIGPENAIF